MTREEQARKNRQQYPDLARFVDELRAAGMQPKVEKLEARNGEALSLVPMVDSRLVRAPRRA